MAEVSFQGEDLRSLARKARDFSFQVKNVDKEMKILGPARAALPRFRGLKGIQLLLKAGDKERLDAVLQKTLTGIKGRYSVSIYS